MKRWKWKAYTLSEGYGHALSTRLEAAAEQGWLAEGNGRRVPRALALGWEWGGQHVPSGFASYSHGCHYKKLLCRGHPGRAQGPPKGCEVPICGGFHGPARSRPEQPARTSLSAPKDSGSPKSLPIQIILILCYNSNELWEQTIILYHVSHDKEKINPKTSKYRDKIKAHKLKPFCHSGDPFLGSSGTEQWFPLSPLSPRYPLPLPHIISCRLLPFSRFQCSSSAHTLPRPCQDTPPGDEIHHHRTAR